jgi:hypothetical protein
MNGQFCRSAPSVRHPFRLVQGSLPTPSNSRQVRCSPPLSSYPP